MAKETTAFKTGMTVLRGGNVPAYTLEYLTPGKRKKAGEFETIVIPYIELGRGATCTIQYGDDNLTVSRKHAAIERRGNEYFLKHLSQSNPTLLNGTVIPKEAQLKNGDEIQLSMEGPKLRFNATSTGTASMGFTRKISLVTRQAIKPYRTLVFALLALIIIMGGTAGWFINDQNQKVIILDKALAEAELQRKQDSLKLTQSFAKQVTATSRELEKVINSNSKNIELINQLKAKLDTLKPAPVVIQPNGTAFYDQYKGNIYFLEVVEIIARWPDGTSEVIPIGWTGTAFLCSDGKLVTARHCIQGWRYGMDELSMLINYAECNGGEVFAKFRATSINDSFEFDYSDVVLDDKTDVTYSDTIETGSGKSKQNVEIFFKSYADWGHDWAYFQTSKTSNIEYDKDISTKQKAGEKVYILGFSLGKGGPQEGKVNPFYCESSIGQEGLSSDGMITITSRSFEQGNSGGPAFVKAGDNFKVIGIVSKGEFDATESFATIAYICPIANIK
jgi:hypothetical protein